MLTLQRDANASASVSSSSNYWSALSEKAWNFSELSEVFSWTSKILNEKTFCFNGFI